MKTHRRGIQRREIVIVGSGFAGSILARILALQGRDVLLVERGAHPRFALGESATPLAGSCLERLARRYGMEDLHALAAHGRWRAQLPHLRCGLKRGFTFFGHEKGRAFSGGAANGPGGGNRLLVAASPHDGVADCHWLREDVDHHLARQAVAAGAELRQHTTLSNLEPAASGSLLEGEGPDGPFRLQARLLVDASGRGAFVSRRGFASSKPRSPSRPASLLFTHLRGVAPFQEVALAAGVSLEPGPYPDDQAAVHHLLEQGWMYQLPFDHGVTSAGFVGAENDALAALPPEAAWQTLLSRYPSLQAQLEDAQPVIPMQRLTDIRHRLDRAVGPGWVALPHTYAFSDPLFSTGMAWSLVAVERLAQLCTAAPAGLPDQAALAPYEDQLRREADHLEDLVEGAYAALPSFDLFTSFSFLYFAAASFQELRQRLVPSAREPAWEGFLGATDSVSRAFVREGRRCLEALRQAHGEAIPAAEAAAFAEWVRQRIAPRNVAGLADPARCNLYPVDLDVLLERSSLLGLDRCAVEAALPLLRGASKEGRG